MTEKSRPIFYLRVVKAPTGHRTPKSAAGTDALVQKKLPDGAVEVLFRDPATGQLTEAVVDRCDVFAWDNRVAA